MWKNSAEIIGVNSKKVHLCCFNFCFVLFCFVFDSSKRFDVVLIWW